MVFLIAVLDKGSFLSWNVFVRNWDIDRDGAWLNVNLQSGWMWWLSNLEEESYRKMRFKIELESWSLLEYLVGKNLVGLESSNWKESAILKRMSLWVEWYGKSRSQKLFLMLKFSVMIKTLLILTSVSLR